MNSEGGSEVPAKESGEGEGRHSQGMERNWFLSDIGSRIIWGNLRAHLSSSLCIVNDMLTVVTKETQSEFSVPVPTPTFSSLPILSAEQQEMVQVFSTQSGISLQWSQK